MNLFISGCRCFQKHPIRFEEVAAQRIEIPVEWFFLVQPNQAVVPVEDAETFAQTLGTAMGGVQRFIRTLPAENCEGGP